MVVQIYFASNMWVDFASFGSIEEAKNLCRKIPILYGTGSRIIDQENNVIYRLIYVNDSEDDCCEKIDFYWKEDGF